MPGRAEPIEHVWSEIAERDVAWVACVAPRAEIERTSPDYARALREMATPVPVKHSPIADFGVPQDPAGFWALAVEIADGLRGGQSVLLHCGAGIGRTGVMASAVLLALGYRHAELEALLSGSGSAPEMPSQRAFLRTLPPK